MSRFIAEKIKIGFMNPEPISTYYGYFETEEKAIKHIKENFKDFEFIEYENFFQKDCGSSVLEIYIQDVENESFKRNIENCKYLNKQYFNESKMINIKEEK